jgi:hypothetical protein
MNPYQDTDVSSCVMSPFSFTWLLTAIRPGRPSTATLPPLAAATAASATLLAAFLSTVTTHPALLLVPLTPARTPPTLVRATVPLLQGSLLSPTALERPVAPGRLRAPDPLQAWYLQVQEHRADVPTASTTMHTVTLVVARRPAAWQAAAHGLGSDLRPPCSTWTLPGRWKKSSAALLPRRQTTTCRSLMTIPIEKLFVVETVSVLGFCHEVRSGKLPSALPLPWESRLL